MLNELVNGFRDSGSFSKCQSNSRVDFEVELMRDSRCLPCTGITQVPIHWSYPPPPQQTMAGPSVQGSESYIRIGIHVPLCGSTDDMQSTCKVNRRANLHCQPKISSSILVPKPTCPLQYTVTNLPHRSIDRLDMSSIGPQLPPHLSKRKRSSDDESPDSPPAKSTRPSNEGEVTHNGAESDGDSDDGYGPSAPRATAGPKMPPHKAPTPATTTKATMGPTMPASSNTDDDDDDDDDDDTTGPAPLPPPKRIHGPAPPPAPLSERPTPASPSASSSDSDDDYGPALPTAASRGPIGPSLPPSLTTTSAAPERLQRDDWMLAPPSASGGYQERDPTKIKSRKFASGVTATTRPRDGTGGGGISSIWTETPEEKAKRLADAVLGRGSATEREQQATSKGGASGVSGIGERRQDENKIRAFTEQTRGKSLYEEHQAAKKAGKASAGGGNTKEEGEEDDDPSKRAFDREKDMALSGKITASQRKDLLNRASDFGGRFSKGNYL